MAGGNCDSFNNKQLWQLISGTGFLRPESYVQFELDNSKSKLLNGISFYKKRVPSKGDALKKERKLTDAQCEFVLKLSQLVSLDAFQSHDLFCAFLFGEFRGSQKELKNILASERHSQTLLLKIRDFYYSERLYLLRCLRQMIVAWVEDKHAYKNVFDGFLKGLLENNLLGQKLLSQWDEVCSTPIPDKENNGSLMTQGLVMSWAVHNLKEQTELLEMLLIYYKYIEMEGDTLLSLCEKFKKHLFGWGQSFKHLVNKELETMIQRIGYLEVVLLMESFDLTTALDALKAENEQHVILGNKDIMEKVNNVMTKLGSEPIHGPLLLGWAVLQYVYVQTKQRGADSQSSEDREEMVNKAQAGFQHFGNKALQLSVFDTLSMLIETDPFCGKTHLAFIVHSTVFYVVSALLSIFHEDSLGNSDALYRIAAKLLQWDAIAEIVWKDSTEGLAALFESSRQLFPLDFACFMKFSISLARAGRSSVKQLKACLSKMRGYTEPLDCNRAQDLEVTLQQNVFLLRRNKHPLESSNFAIERGCKGELLDVSALRAGLANYGHVIQWDSSYNGWQLLMAQIQELLAQVSHGAGMVQTEQLLKVTLVMELVKEVMTSDPSSIPEFTDIISLCYQLILRFSVLSPAPLELLGHTIHCVALATPHMPEQVTHHLKQTGLLPFLTENIDDFEEVLTCDGVSQGLYGNVLASTECPQGLYPVTIAVLELVTQLVVSSSSVSTLQKRPSAPSGRHRSGSGVSASSGSGGGHQLASSEHLASVLFILRDVFPVFHKWRFLDFKHQKLIGQKCLQLFHKVLNFSDLPATSGSRGQTEEEMDSDQMRASSSSSLATHLGLPPLPSSKSSLRQVPKKLGPSLKECCVFSLLFTGAGRALLDIVATGVDTVQTALAQQRSMNEGPGVDLVQLIEMSLSLLNRLLLLKPPNLGVSPVESALSSQPPGQQHQQRHLVSVIAQYIYHRHSHRLPALATVLLKRLAMVSPMSILACLGNDADAIRDMYLTRLQAVSEDVQLKVGILELLSVCVESQPGLIEIFLNVVTTQQLLPQQQKKSLASQAVKDASGGDSGKPELTLGTGSCLPIVLDLLSVDKQCTYQCPPRLLASGLAFLHTLWQAMRETPMTVLRGKKSFWPSVLSPLQSDLPELEPQDPQSIQAHKLKTKILSYSLRITALEIYATSSSKLDTNFKTTLQSVFEKSRLQYWSEVVKKSLHSAAHDDSTGNLDKDDVTDLPTAIVLLQAWKNILVTSARFKVAEVGLQDKVKARILHDLLNGITEQFKAGEMTQLKVKLASVASALYFTLVNMWGKDLFPSLIEEFQASARTVSVPSVIVKNLVRLVEESCMTCDKLLPSVHIGVLGAVLSILQQCGNKLDNLPEHLSSLLPVLCSVFHQSTRQLTTLIQTTNTATTTTTSTITATPSDDGETPQNKALAGHIKLQIVSVCLLLETLQLSRDVDTSIKVIQAQGVVPSLLATTQAFITGKQGISYIYSSLLLLTKMAESEVGASMLLTNNLTSHLCMAVTSCYSNDDPSNQACTSLQKVFSSLRPSTVTWHTLYCLTLDLFGSMLRVLKHAFLEDCLNLVGVHQERMHVALKQAQVSLSPAHMKEAESTCNVFLQLAAYQRQWRFLLPDVLVILRDSLMSLLQTYSALIIRPRYLMHILGHGKGSEGSKPDTLLQTSSLLQQQTSLDDVEQPSTRLVETQRRMLVIISKALSCLRQFSPNLTEIMMDQSVDVTEWEPILDVAFNTPSLDGPLATGVSFGTLLYLTPLCVRYLAKSDNNKSSSPHRLSPSPLETNKTTIASSSTTTTTTNNNNHTVPRAIIQHVLESSLDLLMSQACRYLRDHNLSARDRQYLKRELGTEMNLFLSSFQRQMRRGGSSVTPPQSSQPLSSIVPPSSSQTPQPLNRTLSTTSFSTVQEPGYVRLAQAFVQQVLR